MLAPAESEARTALAELRELAHGIHPAVLEEAGLGPALATLAAGAPMPVEVREDLGERLPPASSGRRTSSSATPSTPRRPSARRG